LVFIPYDRRDRHTLVLGKTGQGKTSLLARHAFKDMKFRRGAVVVIDPKGGIGGLAEILSRYIPEKHLDDCVWIDMENPIPLDFTSYPEGHRESVVADLTYILTRGNLDASAVEISKNIENLLYTLLNVNENPRVMADDRCTLLDVYRFFKDPERQQFILNHITDPDLASEWTKGDGGSFPNQQAQGRILSRVNPLVRSEAMRKVFDDPNPCFNIPRFLDRKGIILASLPVKHPASMDYGSFLVSKIQHAAFSRDDIPESQRTPVFLYIDEFRNFRASKDFTLMLTMARSFKLCLTLADLHLPLIDPDVRRALRIIDNYIVLKVDDDDAQFFSSMLSRTDKHRELAREINERIEQWNSDGRHKDHDEYRELLNFLRYANKVPMWDEDHILRLARKAETMRERWIAHGRPMDNPLYLSIKRLIAKAEATPSAITIDDLKALKSFEAIYLLADQEPVKRPLHKAPPKEPTKEQREKLDYIRTRTQKFYGARPARFGTNRNPQSTSRHSTANLQDKGDDIWEPESKDHGHPRKGPTPIR
jgi:hypothetical protein